jgi:hypothetical protein
VAQRGAISEPRRPLGLPRAPPSAPQKIDIDLSKPFDTRSPWHFLASQEPSVTDSVTGTVLPGLIHFCLRAGPTAQCDPPVAIPQPPAPMPADAWEPHYLNHAGVVYSRGRGSPLFLVKAASDRSANGNQAIFTGVLAYHRSNDRFEQIYAHVTFRNNNQEDRFITSGPLQGSVISVEPTSNAPFAYWVTVHELESTLAYKQVLRYRSATRYADGNRLPVIDSEMPNIELRLGLWHPGLPLPVPASPAHPCPNPRLSHTALWCS